MREDGVFREDILDFCLTCYGTVSEHPWFDSPGYEVLRHPNGKWYGIIMDVPGNRIGFDSNERIDILVCKCAPMLLEILLGQKGFLPAYHMNKEHWVTILLDGSVKKDLAFQVLEEGYRIIDKKTKRRSAKK